MVQLVIWSGLIESPEVLAPTEVGDYLREHEHLVEAWTLLSAGKRTPSGWYFVDRFDVCFEVGYYPGGPCRSFNERVLACAEFSVREVNAIAAERQEPGVLARPWAKGSYEDIYRRTAAHVGDRTLRTRIGELVLPIGPLKSALFSSCGTSRKLNNDLGDAV